MTKFLTFTQIFIEKYDGDQKQCRFSKTLENFFVRRRNNTDSEKKDCPPTSGLKILTSINREFLTQSEFSRYFRLLTEN